MLQHEINNSVTSQTLINWVKMANWIDCVVVVKQLKNIENQQKNKKPEVIYCPQSYSQLLKIQKKKNCWWTKIKTL